MARAWTQTFKVTGRGRFPIDMLRYDRCCPMSEASSHVIERSHEEFPTDPLTVEVVRYVTYKDDLPTAERWKSFGWAVSGVETRKG